MPRFQRDAQAYLLAQVASRRALYGRKGRGRDGHARVSELQEESEQWVESYAYVQDIRGCGAIAAFPLNHERGHVLTRPLSDEAVRACHLLSVRYEIYDPTRRP